jgi:8-oxo-dGTP pyrophosphatase MutT (NUDIX family)
MNGLDIISNALKRRVSDDDPVPGVPRHVSVCMVIAGPILAPSICFIRRAKREGDPWSEHIALPGGQRKGEETAIETARREVEEEVGISIAAGKALTQLPQLRIHLAEKEHPLLLNSFAYFAGEFLPPLRCDSEVESAFWVSISDLWDAKNLDCLMLGDKSDTLVYPALRIPQGLIFGITLRVLTLLSDRMEFPLDHLEDIPLLRRTKRSSR